jgi:hypothetical protein
LVEENFLLKEEILQCVESLSAKCLGQNASIKLDTKYLPEKLQGDVNKFRLALHCVVEFVLTYCKEGEIDLGVHFAGMTNYIIPLFLYDLLESVSNTIRLSIQ